jgi:mRNA-degrading endonuclease RelE of RelBE toxin-antitoxin system
VKAYTVVLSKKATKSVLKLDAQQRQTISKWIEKNLSGCENPKPLPLFL